MNAVTLGAKGEERSRRIQRKKIGEEGTKEGTGGPPIVGGMKNGVLNCPYRNKSSEPNSELKPVQALEELRRSGGGWRRCLRER